MLLPLLLLWCRFSGSCAQCEYMHCPSGHWSLSLPPGINWDGFQGVRVIAVPGSPAYARNHGVYLTNEQVGAAPPSRGLPWRCRGLQSFDALCAEVLALLWLLGLGFPEELTGVVLLPGAGA